MAEERNNKKKEYINHYLNDIYMKDEAQQFFDAVKKRDKSLDNSLIEVWEESRFKRTIKSRGIYPSNEG